MAVSSLFSVLFLLLIISLFSTALTSIHGLNDHSSIQQVVSSDGHDDLLMSAYNQFSAFKEKYNKTYLTQEEDDYRFGVFMSNLRQARSNQILDPTARGYLRFDGQIQLPKHLKTAPILPTNNNWRDDGAVTGVKHQRAYFLATDQLVDMSEHQLLDCSDECTDDKRICNLGCNGGNHVLAYRYMLKVGGIQATKDYPYTGINGSCKFNNNKIVASIYEFNDIAANEDQYAANLVEYGTTYTGGIACPPCSGALNHEVTLVGYGCDRYWICKNSFGTNFGENGYYRLCKGRLTCDENPVATFPFST
ncbi:hypothetical protein ACOSQ3_011267 [Xanthoceras sorbifolium]